MKKALIIVDYQNDFVCGAMANDPARKIEMDICKKIDTYLASGDDLIFLMDTHTSEDLCPREFSNSQRLHCMRDTKGWEIYGKVAEYVPMAKHIILKNNYGSSELVTVLQKSNYDVVELAGLTTHACVLSNAIISAAAIPYAEIVVDAACTASSDVAKKEQALEIMRGLHIQVVS